MFTTTSQSDTALRFCHKWLQRNVTQIYFSATHPKAPPFSKHIMMENCGAEYKSYVKKSNEMKSVSDLLKGYSDNVELIAEFPSARAIDCQCSSQGRAENMHDVHGTHLLPCNEGGEVKIFDIERSAHCLYEAKSSLQEACNLLRRPGKEILLTVASDLDRISHHNVPYSSAVQYYIGGYSLRMESVRGIFHQIIDACDDLQLNVKVVAFDGQFLEVATVDDAGMPLTICKLQKKIWEESKKLSKQEQIRFFTSQNHFDTQSPTVSLTSTDKGVFVSKTDYPVMLSPSRDIIDRLKEKQTRKQSESEETEIEFQDDCILQHLPDDIVKSLNPDSLATIRSISKSLSVANTDQTTVDEKGQENHDTSDEVHTEVTRPEITEYESVLCGLIASSSSDRWSCITIEEFLDIMSNADSINRHFTVAELKVILQCSDMCHKNERKFRLVNIVSDRYGDGSKLANTKIYHVKSLKAIVAQTLHAMPKQLTNVLYAMNTFQKKLKLWEEKNTFNSTTTIATDSGREFVVDKWYAQPLIYKGRAIQPIIDPHHIFVNNRSRVCRFGMPGMGISKNAWISVSENGTGLTIEHVTGLIDRQRNSFAQLTFSKCVEEEMYRTGFTNEANWCSLIRHFYRAVDEAGVSVEYRITWLHDMRGFLLTQYNPMKFPPPGGFVKDMPMAQFEGLLTNIDRRLQLYQLTQNGSYCHRAISSLDSESMFGSFQDLDPKGTGHLKADDIPTALGNATCLFQLKHNINRGFSLSTTKRPKVYNDEPLMDERVLEDKEFDEGATAPSATSDMLSSNVIRARSHPFDRVERRKVHARRQSGKLSTLDCQAKGAQGYRYYHRLNEEKIFAHRRNRIPDKDIDSAVQKMES